MTKEEQERNVVGSELLFIGKRHQMFKMLDGIYENGKKSGLFVSLEEFYFYFLDANKLNDSGKPFRKWFTVGPTKGFGLAGEVCYDSSARDIGTVYCTLFPGTDEYKDISVSFEQLS